jgi:Clp amino terminal domain, pathogenicity island component
MFERFSPDARAAVVHAQEHTRRLGHRYLGCEHLLLAVVSADQPASAILREYGVTPERVEEEIVHRVGLGAGAGLFGALDRDALASIGIDLDAVRARIEASFGPGALAHASQTVGRRRRRARLNPRRAVPPALVRRLRRRRQSRRGIPTGPAPVTAGRYQFAGPRPAGHIRFTDRAKMSLANTVREAQALNDSQIGVEHLALGLIAMNGGLVPPIISAIGTPAPTLRTAILNRYRKAS